MKRISSKLSVLDVFSGAGGLSEGFIQQGFHVSASIEIDKYSGATQILNHHIHKKYKTEVIAIDVRRIDKITTALDSFGFKQFDVIMGGPPCQGFSRLNMKTKNFLNPNNHLVWDFLKLVDKYRPPLVVIENVADLVHFARGRWVDEIGEFMKSLQYNVELNVLNAADYGVPQHRNRSFIIGVKKNGLKIVFPEKNCFKPDNYITTWEAISDLPILNNGTSVDTLPYSKIKPQNEYQKTMRAKKNNGTISNNLVTNNNELIIERYKHIPQGGNWKDIPNYLMLNYRNLGKCHHSIYRRLQEDKPAVTIANFRKNMIIHPKEDRGLSVREAARLQSFPDNFVFTGGIASQQQQVANAVPPLLANAIANSVRYMFGK